jgi:hypothetical protein
MNPPPQSHPRPEDLAAFAGERLAPEESLALLGIALRGRTATPGEVEALCEQGDALLRTVLARFAGKRLVELTDGDLELIVRRGDPLGDGDGELAE